MGGWMDEDCIRLEEAVKPHRSRDLNRYGFT
jgi:hypothetical protein